MWRKGQCGNLLRGSSVFKSCAQDTRLIRFIWVLGREEGKFQQLSKFERMQAKRRRTFSYQTHQAHPYKQTHRSCTSRPSKAIVCPKAAVQSTSNCTREPSPVHPLCTNYNAVVAESRSVPHQHILVCTFPVLSFLGDHVKVSCHGG